MDEDDFSDAGEALLPVYLREWGLSEETIKYFCDNKITVDLLQDINDFNLKELVPNIRERILIRVGAMLKDLASLILKHTVVSRRHLTPELAIRVVDHTCPLWTVREDQSPFKDPFWAFYWPGGQATARYILDNGFIVENKKVLDVGCGCGAGSIAAVKMNAKRVLANDIDLCALTATKINGDLNGVNLEVSSENFIGSKCEDFDTIMIGDMFYDPEFAGTLFNWLQKLSNEGKTILIGDPGRHGLTDCMKEHITLLSTYKLTKESLIENNGFADASVWKIK